MCIAFFWGSIWCSVFGAAAACSRLGFYMGFRGKAIDWFDTHFVFVFELSSWSGG